MIHKNCSKVSVIHDLNRSTSNYFGNKQCRYNEGPLSNVTIYGSANQTMDKGTEGKCYLLYFKMLRLGD